MWGDMFLLANDGTMTPYWSCSVEVHDDPNGSMVAGYSGYDHMCNWGTR